MNTFFSNIRILDEIQKCGWGHYWVPAEPDWVVCGSADQRVEPGTKETESTGGQRNTWYYFPYR